MPNEGSNLPTLRVTRDRRGYENTFLLDTGRRRQKGGTRILYWFRTPPGVRVGRAPLDSDALRLIEAHHPDLQFDWPQILKGEEGSSAPAAHDRDRRDPNGRAGPDRGPVTNGDAVSHGRPPADGGPRRRRKKRRGGGPPSSASGDAAGAGLAEAPDPGAPGLAAAPSPLPDDSPGE